MRPAFDARPVRSATGPLRNRLTNWDVTANLTSPGVIRVVGLNLALTELPDSDGDGDYEVANLAFTGASTATGTSETSASGVVIVQANGDTVEVLVLNGTIHVGE